VRREGVTQAAGRLQRAGLIRHRRGQVTIIDRTGLEAGACECYDTARRSYATPRVAQAPTPMASSMSRPRLLL
jgi:hypothetical protein